MNPFEYYKETLEEYIKRDYIQYIERAWKEKHRVYHDVQHLMDVLKYIELNKGPLDKISTDILILAAFFHDVYYNPRDNKNNEDESIRRFLASYNHNNAYVEKAVVLIIEATKYRKRPNKKLSSFFWEADNNGFYKGFDELLKNEHKLRKEFYHVPKKRWKEGRIKFINSNFGLFNSDVDKDLRKLINWVKINY